MKFPLPSAPTLAALLILPLASRGPAAEPRPGDGLEPPATSEVREALRTSCGDDVDRLRDHRSGLTMSCQRTIGFSADLARASQNAVRLSLDGDRVRQRGGGEVVSTSSLTLQGDGRLFVKPDLDAENHLRAWGLVGGADVRTFTTDLPVISGDRTFYRVGLTLGAFYLSTARNLYSLQGGAFVAEQGALMGSQRLRPYGSGLGTYRASDDLVLRYGFGYTYDLGRGLALPFLGVDWGFAPAWWLDVLLPRQATVRFRVEDHLTLGFGATTAGDFFEYRATNDPEVEDLRIARLRLGASGRLALGAVRLGMEAGVERASIDTGPSTLNAAGPYAGLSIGYVFGGPTLRGEGAPEGARRRGGFWSRCGLRSRGGSAEDRENVRRQQRTFAGERSEPLRWCARRRSFARRLRRATSRWLHRERSAPPPLACTSLREECRAAWPRGDPSEESHARR